MADKPRVRVPAGTTLIKPGMPAPNARTIDSFVNFAAKMGVGTGNLSDASGYDFNFITRQRTGLEAAYRGSWVVGAAVDHAADDMTSSGINFDTTLDPDGINKMKAAMRDLQLWQKLGQTIKWARLYGGALGVLMIDGQNTSTPLNLDSIGEGKFRGIYPMDRWMVNPVLGDLVDDFGPDYGLPKFYETVAMPQDGQAGIGIVPGKKIHYSRVVRLTGIDLPYQQFLSENLWGMSVIERMFDRLIAFDSTTQGVAQLVYKAYLRTWKLEGLRDLIASGGPMLEAVVKQVQFTAMMQSNEGVTMLDSADEFETHSYTFTGLDNVLLQFGQQLAGAIEEPLTRLFGMSPAGLNATGESDMQIYADNINKKQESQLRAPVTRLLDITARSVLGRPLPDGFTFDFVPIRQPTPEQRATIFSTRTQAVVGAFEAGLVQRDTALKELKQGSDVDGGWTNISDEEISDAESDPPLSEFAENELNPPEPEMPPGAKVTAMPKKDAA